MKMKDVIHVFNKEQCKDLAEEQLIVVRDKDVQVDLPGKVMSYEEDFESLLKYSVPAKTRKINYMMDMDQIADVLDRVSHGTLSFMVDDLPYSTGLNHTIVDGRIFFHCAMGKGFKLNGIGKRASYYVVEDLGVAQIGTYNYQSVYMVGQLEEVHDFDTKKAVLLRLVEHLAPQHPYNDEMPLRTCIIELKPEFISGKTHIL
ncbi:MAG: pyridoxamine 5'-phosphate oxidase family protein [Erysipelotrichaceae bacterium]|nr:pyridoxamine 5'-phosphate oxidase family protein [Erysipelotrichaceae bacterium]